MRGLKRNKAKYIIFSLVGVILLVGMLMYVDIDRLWAAIGRASPIWIILSAVTYPLAFIIRAWRWKILLEPVKNPVTIFNTYWATSIGFMVNSIIPIRLGEFIRAYILSKKEELSYAGSLSSIIVERTFDLLGLMVLALASILLLPLGTVIPPWVADALRAIGILIAIILAVIVIGIRREDSIIGLLDRMLKPIFFLSKRRDRILGFAMSLISGVKGISRSPKILSITLASTLLLWLISVLGIYLIFMAFEYQAPLTIIFFGAVLLWCTYILPSTPGYVGTFEAYWVLIFLGLGLSGMDILLAMALISHIIGLIVNIALGYIGILWLGISFEEVLKISDVNHQPSSPTL